MVCWIVSRRMHLQRVVDDEGDFLDLVVQHRRHTEAASKQIRRLQHNQPMEPEMFTTDGLA